MPVVTLGVAVAAPAPLAEVVMLMGARDTAAAASAVVVGWKVVKMATASLETGAVATVQAVLGVAVMAMEVEMAAVATVAALEQARRSLGHEW